VRYYQYEVKQLPASLLAAIEEAVRDGERLLPPNSEGISPQHAMWIESFGAIVRNLDPNSVPMSDSIGEVWRTAHWFFHNSHPKTPAEEAIVFGQLLGVAKSLLVGHARILTREIKEAASASVFHRRELALQKNLVFVLMPFTEKWSDYIWKEQIKPIVESSSTGSLICKRADDLFGHDVMVDIYESIATARIVIAEVTNRNANVFYELGIAHTLGKDVILLAQGPEHIPFDLNRFRHCIYSNDGPGYEVLRVHLPNAIASIIGSAEPAKKRTAR
jgi:hypothetical protein